MLGARETRGWGVDGDGGRRAERTAFTFLHGLVNEPFQFLGLAVLRLRLQQPPHVLQGLFIFIRSGRVTHPLRILSLLLPIRRAFPPLAPGLFPLPPPLPPPRPTQWSRVHKPPQLCGVDKPREITAQGLGLHPTADVTLLPTPSAPGSSVSHLPSGSCYHPAPLYPTPPPAYRPLQPSRGPGLCDGGERREGAWPPRPGGGGEGALCLTLSR